MKPKLFIFLFVLTIFGCDKPGQDMLNESIEYEIYVNGKMFKAAWYNLTQSTNQIHFEATDSTDYFEILFNKNHVYPKSEVRFLKNDKVDFYYGVKNQFQITSSGPENNFSGDFNGTMTNGSDTINLRGILRWQKN